jgi:hypothetical protein
LYTIIIKLVILMKQISLVKICLNETYSKVTTGRHFSDAFPIQNGLKQ